MLTVTVELAKDVPAALKTTGTELLEVAEKEEVDEAADNSIAFCDVTRS